MPDSVKSVWYIKYNSLISTRGIELSINSISNNCEKIISRTGKEAKFSENIATNNILKTEFSKMSLRIKYIIDCSAA